MEHEVISMREIQRNYKKIFDRVRSARKPVFLGSRGKAQVVLLDVESFEKLQGDKKHKNALKSWEALRREFDYLAKQGDQNVNLAQLVREDRQTH
jgi:prevent-host-death family protein